jgi:hypothetical protein
VWSTETRRYEQGLGHSPRNEDHHSVIVELSGEGGIRTGQENPAKGGVSDIGGAESGARTGQLALIGPGLARIAEAWPRLPEAIRKAMLLLAESKE